MLKRQGVYTITCIPTGEVYVGSAPRSFARRFATHRHALRSGRSYCPRLRAAWLEHGEAAFRFEPLIVCAPDMVLVYEQLVLDAFKPKLNILPNAASCLGVKHGHEVRVAARERCNLQWENGQHTIERLVEYNHRRSERFEVDGLWLTVREISDRFAIPLPTVRARVRAGRRGADLLVQRGWSPNDPERASRYA